MILLSEVEREDMFVYSYVERSPRFLCLLIVDLPFITLKEIRLQPLEWPYPGHDLSLVVGMLDYEIVRIEVDPHFHPTL